MARLLLSDARTELRDYVRPVGAADSVVDGRLNEVAERFTNAGKWKGATSSLVVSVYDGMVTMPASVETILAVRYNRTPTRTRPPWFQYMANGSGKVDAGKASAGPAELPDLVCTFRDPTGTFYLKAETAGSEAALAKIWIEGLDQDGDEVFTSPSSDAVVRGHALAINGGTDTSVQFTTIRAIVKPLTRTQLKLTAVDVTSGAQTLIGFYEPGETAPQYKRYLVSDNAQHAPVEIFAKRAFVAAKADHDMLVPGNRGAYKLGLLALNYEDSNDNTLAAGYWKDAFALLNNELKEHLGVNTGGIQVQGAGFGAHGIAGMM